MFSEYKFLWRVEALFALVTWLVFMLGAFVATGDAPVDDWRAWFITTSIAAARVTAQGLIAGLVKLLASLAARRGTS